MKRVVLIACLSLSALSALSTASCSWTRFDDLGGHEPIVYLDRPDSVAALFGNSLAGGDGVMLVGGQAAVTGGAIWRVDDAPSKTPLTNVCVDQGRCRLVGTPASIGDAQGGKGCFAYGVGLGDASLGDNFGIVGGCADGTPVKLAVPPEVAQKVIAPLLQPFGSYGFSGLLALAGSGGRVVAASPDVGRAWTYGAGNALVTVGTPADSDATFGVAVASAGDVMVVSAPGAGKVFFYDLDAAGTAATLRGCVKRQAPWGVVLHGFKDGGRSLLAVSDGAGVVEVIDATSSTGPCAAPEVVGTFACAENDDVKGCSGGAFGYSLGTGDLDGDGDLELLVGAPGLDVRKKPNGGAVLVFDLEGLPTPKDTVFLSSAEPEDHLGTSVAAVRLGARDILAAGVPGEKKKVALFYCSALGGAGKADQRCQ